MSVEEWEVHSCECGGVGVYSCNSSYVSVV